MKVGIRYLGRNIDRTGIEISMLDGRFTDSNLKILVVEVGFRYLGRNIYRTGIEISILDGRFTDSNFKSYLWRMALDIKVKT